MPLSLSSLKKFVPEMGTETRYIFLVINHNVTLVSEAPNARASKVQKI